jgi:hypothetical protein
VVSIEGFQCIGPTSWVVFIEGLHSIDPTSWVVSIEGFHSIGPISSVVSMTVSIEGFPLYWTNITGGLNEGVS